MTRTLWLSAVAGALACAAALAAAAYGWFTVRPLNDKPPRLHWRFL